MLVKIGAILLLISVVPAAAVSTFLPSQSVTIPAQKDAMIFGDPAGNDTGNSSGKGPAMFVGADGSLNKKRSLIQFDIASYLPPDAVIGSVTLTLYLGQVAGSGTGGNGSGIPQRTIDLYRLQQDWGEGDSGSPTQPNIGGSGQGYPRVTGDSGWDYAFYDSSDPTSGKWNDGVSDLHGGNFAANLSASSTFSSPYTLNTPYTWNSPQMTTDVQNWLDDSSSNHGWLIMATTGLDDDNNIVDLETTARSFLGFWTKDGAAANDDPALTPTLTVDYLREIPEPAGGALLLCAMSVVHFVYRPKHRI